MEAIGCTVFDFIMDRLVSGAGGSFASEAQGAKPATSLPAAATTTAAASAPAPASPALPPTAASPSSMEGQINRALALTGTPAAVMLLYGRGTQGETALFAAAASGHLSLVSRLLVAGANANVGAVGYGHATPLYAASDAGHADVVSLLVSAGADVNLARSDVPCSPLHAAVRGGFLDVVSVLVVRAVLLPVWLGGCLCGRCRVCQHACVWACGRVGERVGVVYVDVIVTARACVRCLLDGVRAIGGGWVCLSQFVTTAPRRCRAVLPLFVVIVSRHL